jgi:hypothetical protein
MFLLKIGGTLSGTLLGPKSHLPRPKIFFGINIHHRFQKYFFRSLSR